MSSVNCFLAFTVFGSMKTFYKCKITFNLGKMSYRFHFCKTFSISRSSSRQILHAAVSFPIFLSISGSHYSSQGQ
ncbi:Myosin light chain 2 [Gossypium arboreum]|uniref:Myosin light chain 2 n=1 Tax=Gossypium arboreum TaxID=29729 RepID=A0A0B0PVF0_GOSAR|nr:Myosin light chain 2 [Gossypium arboreum]